MHICERALVAHVRHFPALVPVFAGMSSSLVNYREARRVCIILDPRSSVTKVYSVGVIWRLFVPLAYTEEGEH